jgi:hypothetical protein
MGRAAGALFLFLSLLIFLRVTHAVCTGRRPKGMGKKKGKAIPTGTSTLRKIKRKRKSPPDIPAPLYP